jgi:tetratricopeptide (TPR) repeat protein
LRATRALLLLSVAVLFFLSYYSIRSARAAHAIGLNSRAGFEQAVRLEPTDASNWYLLGRFYLYDFDQPDPDAALRAFLVSRSLDPLSSDTLLDLATNYDENGKTAEARAAYLEAKRVYPLSAEVRWRYGNFLLRQNEIPPPSRKFAVRSNSIQNAAPKPFLAAAASSPTLTKFSTKRFRRFSNRI